MTDTRNLDLVRSMYAAWQRGDYSSADWAHPEIEFVLADGPDPGVWTGVAAMAAAWRKRLSGVEEHRNEAQEYREVDPERILVIHHRNARGKTSRLELARLGSPGAAVIHVRNGKVTRLVSYMNCEHALADVCLKD